VLDDGGKLVQDRATEIRELGELPLKQNDYVVHDCFTGGSVPAELFTREFWWDLVMSVKTDGVVVIVSKTRTG
jgi:spermidine synthase